jgi:hypothetical protein
MYPIMLDTMTIIDRSLVGQGADQLLLFLSSRLLDLCGGAGRRLPRVSRRRHGLLEYQSCAHVQGCGGRRILGN